MKCRVCKTPVKKFLSLGKTPLANSFLKKEEIPHEKSYDLSVGFCQTCFLVQQMKTISPEKIFRNYIYFSSTSSIFEKHCQELADYFVKRFNLTKASLFIELASNIGTFLKFVKEKNVKIVGIDPAVNIAKIANRNGIPTIPEFFNLSFAKKYLRENNEKADVIYGANVLAHVPDVLSFVRGVEIVLKDDGTAIFEFPYMAGLLEMKFDIIYHEHYFYYSLLALINLFNKANLQIYDVQFTPMQGRSLLIYACHPGRYPIARSVKDLAAKETKQKLDKIITYRTLNKKVVRLKKKVLKLLRKLKKDSKTIAAYSSPAKGNTLLNYFGIGKNYLDFIVDKAPAKQGLYTPGTHLLVQPIETVIDKPPDFLIILCWNIYEEVIDEMKKMSYCGKFIILIPKLLVI